MNTPTLELTSQTAPLKPAKTIEQMAAERGIKPFDFEEAWQAAEGIWPADENIDDFTAWLRRERNESARESRFD